jgi:hypothetical protein
VKKTLSGQSAGKPQLQLGGIFFAAPRSYTPGSLARHLRCTLWEMRLQPISPILRLAIIPVLT